jgi:hypothetical protein
MTSSNDLSVEGYKGGRFGGEMGGFWGGEGRSVGDWDQNLLLSLGCLGFGRLRMFRGELVYSQQISIPLSSCTLVSSIFSCTSYFRYFCVIRIFMES